MVRIVYPDYDYRIEKREGKEYLFDPFRRQWVRLTPEEWVRQNTLQYLVQTREYPASLIAVERELRLGELRKRFDIVVFHAGDPWMVIECKEPNVPLNEQVLRQALQYNIRLRASFLVITNGTEVYVFSLQQGTAVMQHDMPTYPGKAGENEKGRTN